MTYILENPVVEVFYEFCFSLISDCVTYIWKFLVYEMCDIHLENPGVGDCVMMCDTSFGKS